MGKISGYTALSIAKRTDVFLGVNNQVSPAKTVYMTQDAMVMAYGGIGFVGNAVNSGANGTTWFVVNKFTTALEEKGLSSTASNNYITIPTGHGGTYLLSAELCLLNDAAGATERIAGIRLTKNGAAISGAAREFSVPLTANRPAMGCINFSTVLVQGDVIRLEQNWQAPGPTAGNVVFISGVLRAEKIRAES